MKKRLLIVEDEDKLREPQLASAGYEVYQAAIAELVLTAGFFRS